MKFKVLSMSTAFLSLLAMAPIQAQDQAGSQPSTGTQPGQLQGGGGGGGQFRQRMLERFDTNHDGTLDDKEKAAMREFMQQRRQARGMNGGGAGAGGGLGAGGTTTGATAGQPSQAGGGPGSGAGGGGQFRQRMLERFDANHDGVLDENEKAQMRAGMQKMRQMRQQGGAAGGGQTPSPQPGGTAGQ